MLGNYSHRPSAFGFSTWLSNFGVFDLDPFLSRQGQFETLRGDSSDVLVKEALKFMRNATFGSDQRPFFVAIWYASPHDPWFSTNSDASRFFYLVRCKRYLNLSSCYRRPLSGRSAPNYHPDCDCFPVNHAMRYYGELRALDRSVGSLRRGLRTLGVENQTVRDPPCIQNGASASVLWGILSCMLDFCWQLVWFSSDNGAQTGHKTPDDPNGGLAGFKKQLLEGGIRVPAIIEWPGVIQSRITWYPACAMDFFPTIADIAGLPPSDIMQPQDGASLVQLFSTAVSRRKKKIPFHYGGVTVMIDNDLKLVRWSSRSKTMMSLYGRRAAPNTKLGTWSDSVSGERFVTLFNLTADPQERYTMWGISDERMRLEALSLEVSLDAFERSLNASKRGLDYPEQRVLAQPPEAVWCAIDAYQHVSEMIAKRTNPHMYPIAARLANPMLLRDTSLDARKLCTFDMRALCPNGSVPANK